jgi:aryl-alcohol dehydrogenase-like predicted oxidoreductase
MLNKLIIGTVQFGINYGITNANGQIKNEELDKIFEFCKNKNILYFDTAQDYGNSEDIISYYIKHNNANYTKNVNNNNNNNNNIYNNKIINKPFNIITKAKFKNKNINDTIQISLKKFNIIDIFLLHSFEDYRNKKVINTLLKYKKNNIIKQIGVSIYNIEDAITLLKENIIDVIQIPFNYLDNQWLENEEFQNLLKYKDNAKDNKMKTIEIHVRSIFLQGLLLNSPLKYPINIKKEEFDNLQQIINDITTKLKLSKLELCFAFINSFEWISKFLIGIDNFEHLSLNYEIINKNLKLKIEDIDFIKSKIKYINKNLISPLNWIY